MRTEIDEDIGAIAGTTPFYALVTAEGECILEVRLECVHHVVLFETEPAGDGIIRMEDAVTAETVGLPAGMCDRYVVTVTTGDFRIT